MAKFMNKSVAGISVPQSMIDRISKAEDKSKTGVEMCAELIKELKGMAQGVHIMAIGWEKKVPDILAAAGL
jgi:5,10-methylenetetrahydrofolate reductase